MNLRKYLIVGLYVKTILIYVKNYENNSEVYTISFSKSLYDLQDFTTAFNNIFFYNSKGKFFVFITCFYLYLRNLITCHQFTGGIDPSCPYRNLY